MNDKLEYLQVKELISSSKISMIGLFGVVITICTVLYPKYRDSNILLWCIGMNILIVLRIFLIYYSLSINIKNYKRLFYIYLLLLGLTSILYSSILLIFFPNDNIYQIFLIIMLIGIISSGVIQNAYNLISLNIYLLSSLLPLFIFFIFYESRLMVITAILLFYYIISLKIGNHIYRRYNIVIKLKNRYSKLISHYNIEKQKIDYFYNYLPLGVFTYNKDLIVTNLNDYLADKIIGVSKDRILGLDLKKLRDKSFLPTLKKAIDSGYDEYEGYYYTTMSDRVLYLKVIASKLDIKDRVEAIAVLIDMTKDIINKEKIEYLAYYDSLTNIYKRDVLIEKLNKVLCAFKESQNEYYSAILYFDIDKFKDINDHLGHNVGDKILKILSERIKKLIDSRYIFARMGGDEFAILMPQVSKNINSIYQKTKELSNKIYEIANQDLIIDNNIFNINLSIGAVIIDKRFEEPYDIIKAADASMYRAKRDNKIFMYIYDEELDNYIKSRYLLKDEIKIALKNGDIELYLQPITNKDHKIVSAEVLARWIHPQKGIIKPEAFLDILIEYNMIEEFSRYILKLSEKISKLLPSDFTLSINITAEDIIKEEFIDFITNLNFHCNIDLELTEQMVINNIEECFKNMNYLKDKGFSFSLDDFGTGYSSLSYLNKLPIKYIKIDKSFIDDMMTDRNDLTIIETIITMAHILDFETIAEGVESKEQLEKLKELGCDRYQGYHLYKPQREDKFLRLLNNNTKSY